MLTLGDKLAHDRPATRKQYTAEDKIRILLDDLIIEEGNHFPVLEEGAEKLRAELETTSGFDKVELVALIESQFAISVERGWADMGNIPKQVLYGCGFASIGLAGGANRDGSVIPLILRDISMYGINSVMQPLGARLDAWVRLAAHFSKDLYAQMVTEVSLKELPDAAKRILKGEIDGLVIVYPDTI